MLGPVWKKNRCYENVWVLFSFFFCEALEQFSRIFNFSQKQLCRFSNGPNGRTACSSMCLHISLVSLLFKSRSSKFSVERYLTYLLWIFSFSQILNAENWYEGFNKTNNLWGSLLLKRLFRTFGRKKMSPQTSTFLTFFENFSTFLKNYSAKSAIRGLTERNTMSYADLLCTNGCALRFD